ncbi:MULTISPECIES: rod shape-determining protein MreD [Bacillaceae]|uniref:rod shape-determining protein MreD n=1 Tax=Bacillaceae TaxID=186817 RepID=UPI002A115380|nr:rod shape-determining protein MreD [Cytobacillus sp. IB215316]MDX8359418.1 rod shape-determining protein MreD [Cytobacillus sp. IB215316]
MRRFYLPLFATFLFIAESTIIDIFPPERFFKDFIYVPRFSLIMFIFITVYRDKLIGIIYAAIFGLLYDVVYTEVIGIYMFSYPVAAYLVFKLMKFLQSNLVIVSVICLFMISFIEYYVYGLYALITSTQMSINDFSMNRLYPTIVLNSIFLVIFSYPLKRYLTKVSEDDRKG